MPRLSRITPLAGCVLSLVCSGTLAAPTPYSTMFVFGDSLSDSGQFPDFSGPSGSGMRFTNRNGPTYDHKEHYALVAPMHLAAKLGIAPGDLAPSTSMTHASNVVQMTMASSSKPTAWNTRSVMDLSALMT